MKTINRQDVDQLARLYKTLDGLLSVQNAMLTRGITFRAIIPKHLNFTEVSIGPDGVINTPNLSVASEMQAGSIENAFNDHIESAIALCEGQIIGLGGEVPRR